MFTPDNLDIAALKAQIDHAASEMMMQQKPVAAVGSERTALLFTGNIHHSIPHELLFSQAIGPTEKTLWGIMRALFSSGHSLAEQPRRKDLAAMVPCSAPTITKSRGILRLHRWLTLCRRVRDDKGRMVGDIYMLHQEPLPVWETLLLDNGYTAFLDDIVRQSRQFATDTRQTAQGLLDEIQNLLEPVQASLLGQLKTRVIATQTIQGKNFSLDHKTTQRKNLSLGNNAALGASREETTALGVQGKNFSLDQGKNFSHSSSCSSSLLTKPTTRVRANGTSGVEPMPGLDQMDQLGGLDETEICHLIGRYFPWLRDHVFISAIADVFLGHLPYLQIIYRILDSEKDTQLSQIVLSQLIGKLTAAQAGQAERVRNLPAYVKSLVANYQKGTLCPDEYGVEVQAAIESGSTYHSPMLSEMPLWSVQQ